MRELWTLDPDLLYLNHGSFGAVPAVTQRMQRRLAETCEANPMRWFRDLPTRLIATRARIGGYLGVPGDTLALVPNATAGINVALHSVPAEPGQRFVLTDHAYGAVLIAARRIAAARGCTVEVVEVPLDANDDDIVAAIGAAVDDTTACVVVDQITSATAKVFPVGRITELAHGHGVPVIVDGAHAPALIDDPVVGDYWTGNLHKWPCGPRGSGVLHVADAFRDSVVPLSVSWDDAAGFPVSFDFPGTTDVTGWVAAPTSLDLLDSLDFAGHRKDLSRLIDEGTSLIADAIGGRVADVSTAPPTMRLLALPEGLGGSEHAAGVLGEYLAPRTGVEVAVTYWGGAGYIRLSAHLYNTRDDFRVAAERYARHFADPAALSAMVTAR